MHQNPAYGPGSAMSSSTGSASTSSGDAGYTSPHGTNTDVSTEKRRRNASVSGFV